MDESDLRVDVYSAAVFTTPDRPETWPRVRITHIPTGTVVTVDDQPSQLRAKAKALVELQTRLRVGTCRYCAVPIELIDSADGTDRWMHKGQLPDGRSTIYLDCKSRTVAQP
jgi:hypothetical protein